MPFELLAHLWLHEPEAETAARAAAVLRQPLPNLAELAEAYASLFLLNVYPYGTTFADPTGELNGPGAQYVAGLYAAHGYQPPELRAVGAPDHLGLGLGFLGYLAERGQQAAFAEACSALLAWAPAACLAAEREPGAHAFYRALARYTAETLLLNAAHAAGRPPMSAIPLTSGPSLADDDANDAEAEVRLRDVVNFLLAPARCGLFLSRSRLGQMGRALGLRLPFGARFEVAERLFQAAGQAGQVEALLAALEAEVADWAAAYRAWAAEYPAWAPVAETWLARTYAARERLTDMQHVLRSDQA